MRSLTIETATDACSVALFEDGRLIGHVHELVGRGHAERLIPMIGGLPDRGRADRVLVDCGPGSFTGVRVGLAAARALGFAWGVPVDGYSSLALAAAIGFARNMETDSLAVALIGGHGEYFVQRFARQGMRQLAPLSSLRPDAAAAACGENPIVGSGAPALQAAGAPGDVIQIDLDAREAWRLPDDLARLPARPIYGRAPDARPMATR